MLGTKMPIFQKSLSVIPSVRQRTIALRCKFVRCCFLGIASLFCAYELNAQCIPDINGLSVHALYFHIKSDELLGQLAVEESQRLRIKQIDARVWDECAKIRKTATDEETPELMREVVSNALDEVFTDVLFESQQIRLVQVIHQSELRRYGGCLSTYLTQPRLRVGLEIDKNVAIKLEGIQDKRKDALREAAEKFRRRASEIIKTEKMKALSILDEKQKDQTEKMIGARNVSVKRGAVASRVLFQVIQERNKK
jgi:hypothetical protein